MTKPANYEQFFEHGLDVDSRTMYLGDDCGGGEIDERVAAQAIKAIHIFNKSPDKPFHVYLNTLGGCQFNGFAIYDMLKTSPCQVNAYVLGAAMSMGSIILQAADKRFIYPNATIMIHNGSMSVNDNVQTLINWSAFLERSLKTMYDIFAERTGKTANFWKKRCAAADHILTAQEALELGLVDEVVRGQV